MSVWRIGIRGLKITLLNPNFVLRRILIRTFLVGLHLKLRLGHFYSYQLVGRCSRRTIGNILKVFFYFLAASRSGLPNLIIDKMSLMKNRNYLIWVHSTQNRYLQFTNTVIHSLKRPNQPTSALKNPEYHKQ